jgi:K+-sensing histidine kinase KdpD
MKMFNRVTGSLSLASKRPNAYHFREVQVLETMVQIVTVSIENAKLYERDRHLLRDAKQREAQLAAINSTLQTITSVLDVSVLLNSFVEKVASLVDVELCVFFQLSLTREELVAEAMYGRPSVSLLDDGSGRPAIEPPHNKEEHEALTRMIRLPFQETFLERQVRDEAFFYLDVERIEELAQRSDEGGVFFLHAIPGQQLLMIPMFYQEDFIGLLSVSLPKGGRSFKPKDVGMLLAICAQASSAIRNAQLFEEREEAYAELQRMDKLKDEFLVTASHELRTPMSAIIGYSSLLKRQSSRIGPADILRFATKISTAAEQLHDLVENMTEAAKMGAVDKNLELKLEPIEVRSVVEIAASTLLLSIEQRIRLRIDERLWVRADGVHMRQVVQLLLDNASKYSPAKSEIVVTAEEETLDRIAEILPEGSIDHMTIMEQGNAPMITVRVHDQGEGILLEDQQRIFEKFVRAPRSLTTPVRGSGLGLYICRRYIEAMGGKLWLEHSALNEGSVFAFYLPQVEPPAEAGE